MLVKLIRDKLSVRDGDDVKPANSLQGNHILLVAKLHEESQKIARDATNPEEYADLLQVMMDLAHLNGVPWDFVEAARLNKLEEKGGFSRGLVLSR